MGVTSNPGEQRTRRAAVGAKAPSRDCGGRTMGLFWGLLAVSSAMEENVVKVMLARVRQASSPGRSEEGARIETWRVDCICS